jgi:hypothetical protein
MRKAQGALEYLIIIAAVLAIAAIVVLFLTGAFSSTKGDLSRCRATTSTCNNGIATGGYLADATGYAAGCLSMCQTACTDASGKDVLTGAAQSCTTATTGCYKCARGNVTGVQVT